MLRNPKGTERDLAIYRLAKLGVSLPDSLRLVSYSRTIQRLSEALCNGDWPYPKPGTYPGAVRGTCESCEATTALGQLKPYRKPGGLLPARAIVRECPLCRTAQDVRQLWARIVEDDLPLLAYETLEVCRDGGPGLAVDDGHGYSDRIAG